MTAKKTTTPARKTASAAAKEVQEENTTTKEPFTFEVEVNGEKVELKDNWQRPGAPAAIGFVDYNPDVYAPIALESIIGAEQLLYLMRIGASMQELASVAPAWLKAQVGAVKN